MCIVFGKQHNIVNVVTYLLNLLNVLVQQLNNANGGSTSEKTIKKRAGNI